ncbi:hypothetical protein BKA93DRAFT_732188 [Sparassis latifolia]
MLYIARLPITLACSATTIIIKSVVLSFLAGALPAAQAAPDQPVCIGDGVDVSSIGLFSILVLCGTTGLLLWLLFAIIRPRYRQVYGLREWFVPQGLRPKPLSRSLLGFLFPETPLVPKIPTNTNSFGKSVARDAEPFLSDEELSQRTLWTAILIASVWTFLALAGLLPLYMVSTPCLAESAPPARYNGVYSALQDLSLLRLLQLLDMGNVTATGWSAYEIIHGHDAAPNARIRVIILTVFAIVLALAPALFLVVREFNKLVGNRERWINEKCEDQDMGWLSARQGPGFVGWGEKRVKDFLTKSGLSSSLETNETNNGRPNRRRRNQDEEEKGKLEIDIQGLFSISDTTTLAPLIEQRDEILENLEIAESKYIQSFRLSTPDPSMVDFQPTLPAISEDPNVPFKPIISRPRPLAPSASQHRRRRGHNPAIGSSSLPPTSYMMPSQFYKIHGVQGISNGQFTNVDEDIVSPAREPTLSDSINQRVVGSRFQEVNGSSLNFDHIPLGSQVTVNKGGHLEPIRIFESPIPDSDLYGEHDSWDTAAFGEGLPYGQWHAHQSQDPILNESEEDWVDVGSEDPEAFDHGEEYPEDTRRRPRPPRNEDHRETFPLRKRIVAVDEIPPHLRLQPRQPFVRPLSGLDHEALGVIYTDINIWRSKLKSINLDISEVQRESYDDIADGARIKGWLLVGRGLRFLPGVQLIEGRAKEDIRWDELQSERDIYSKVAYWITVVMITILLGIGLTAVAGLYLSTAPNYAHYLPFLQRLGEGNKVGGGIATCLASALAAILFTTLALTFVHYANDLNRSISVSASRLFGFKTIFYILTLVPGIWLFTVGSILFAIHSFSIHLSESESVGNGVIYMSAFALMLVLAVAVGFPALLMLQPLRFWRVIRTEKYAVTPRQRFRAVYPGAYNPSYALSCSVVAIMYASTFSLIFPLVAPAALLLLLLTLVAHRFLVGYVYGRTLSQTGGLLQIWLLRRTGTLLAFQPLILGLILLSRRLWVEGGILCGVALFVLAFVEGYCTWRTRQPGRDSLTAITLDSLEKFTRAARPGAERAMDQESTSLVSSARNTRTRGSYASILDMMSMTLAVAPSPSETRGPVPLDTETLDDLTATERAARTHPDAPPHLPPLPFADHAEEMAGMLYAPELLAPPPVIWLPNDVGGVGRSEAYDLQRHHDLRVTLDVRAKEDAASRRSSVRRVHVNDS